MHSLKIIIGSIVISGREKFGWDRTETNLRLVLESDGTHIDDEECLNWLPDNATFILLRATDTWSPNVKKSDKIQKEVREESNNLFPIPRVVCEALNLLEIRHEPPFWKIIDNRGRITLVLHWEQLCKNRIRHISSNNGISSNKLPNPVAGGSITITPDSTSFAGIKIQSVPARNGESSIHVRSDNDIKIPAIGNDRIGKQIGQPQPTAAEEGKVRGKLLKRFNILTESTPASSVETKLPIPKSRSDHVSGRIVNSDKGLHSGSNADKCEFHCGSLHEEGRSIHEVEETHRNRRHKDSSYSYTGKNTHVRFHDQEQKLSEILSLSTAKLHADSPISIRKFPPSPSKHSQQESPDSESEQETVNTNTIEEDFENEYGTTTDKLLLLTDQLSMDRNKKHLTVLDLGVILDRLKGKILDVERLEREIEGPSCYRWLIKATIRGHMLRELGVLYNGSYYSISEDPGIVYAASGFEDEEDRV